MQNLTTCSIVLISARCLCRRMSFQRAHNWTLPTSKPPCLEDTRHIFACREKGRPKKPEATRRCPGKSFSRKRIGSRPWVAPGDRENGGSGQTSPTLSSSLRLFLVSGSDTGFPERLNASLRSLDFSPIARARAPSDSTLNHGPFAPRSSPVHRCDSRKSQILTFETG